MSRLALVVLFVAAGCGRFGFGAESEDAIPEPEEQFPGSQSGTAAPVPVEQGLTGNLVFTSSQTISPLELRSDRKNADAMCNALAAEAGLRGEYVAWISSAEESAISRLSTSRGWRRVDGFPFADLPSDIVSGRVLYPAMYDERGYPATGLTYTATGPDGRHSGADCNPDFGASNKHVPGWSTAAGDSFTMSEIEVPCSLPTHVLCFGVDRVETVSAEVVPDEARLAFLHTDFTPGDGIAAADDACQEAAEPRNLDRNYRALMATRGASAVSRFNDIAEEPWYRLDGVRIGSSADKFLFGEADAPLMVDQNGGYREMAVWVGAPDPQTPGTLDSTCNNWLDKGAEAHAGNSAFAGPQAFVAAGMAKAACDQRAAIFCLEDRAGGLPGNSESEQWESAVDLSGLEDAPRE